MIAQKDNQLILVNKYDQIQGYIEKEKCHDGQGLLHRAFSVFIFDNEKQLLIQKRSQNKRLWPGYWSNTCCSHPRRGESLEQTAHKRLFEECGSGPYNGLKNLYKFQYHARFNGDSENELCHVLIGRFNTQSYSDFEETNHINSKEISDIMWVSKEWLLNDINQHPKIYTPWFKIEAKKLFSDYQSEIDKMYSNLARFL